MESRRKRKRSQIAKWVCYALLMLLCTVLQTLPGLFQLGEAKPLWLLPLALAVAVEEGEFAGGIFGAVCGLMWDYTAGRTAGMLAFELLQLYFKTSAANVVLLETAAVLLVLSLDWLFFYYMPGYSGAVERYLWFVLPTAALTIPVCLVLFGAVRRIHAEFKIDNDVV